MVRKPRQPVIPDTVQIGPYGYSIGCDDSLNRSNLLGETHSSNLNILLNPSQHPTVLRETLIHELLHACFAASSLSHLMSDDDEERIVAVLSPWLLMLLRDNPDVLAWVACDE